MSVVSTLPIHPSHLKKNTSDDVVYHQFPFLQKILYRAFTLVFNLEDQLVTYLTGPRKFSGNDSRDDDDGSDVVIFSRQTVESWARDNVCQVTQTLKANGSFAITKLFMYKDTIYVIFGSKNIHKVAPFNTLLTYLNETEDLSDIVRLVGHDIWNHCNEMHQLLTYFSQGYSLIGELETGCHFTPGDNTVAWIDLFHQGSSTNSNELLKSVGLRTVSSEIVFLQMMICQSSVLSLIWQSVLPKKVMFWSFAILRQVKTCFVRVRVLVIF